MNSDYFDTTVLFYPLSHKWVLPVLGSHGHCEGRVHPNDKPSGTALRSSNQPAPWHNWTHILNTGFHNWLRHAATPQGRVTALYWGEVIYPLYLSKHPSTFQMSLVIKNDLMWSYPHLWINQSTFDTKSLFLFCTDGCTGCHAGNPSCSFTLDRICLSANTHCTAASKPNIA